MSTWKTIVGGFMVVSALALMGCIGDPAEFVDGSRAYPCESDAEAYSGGEGTARAPYVICSEEDLRRLAATREHWALDFGLGANITLTDLWEPIGDEETPFSGDFDGDGLRISNLRVDTTEAAGLFGNVTGRIDALGLWDPEISGGTRVGALAGTLGSGGRVTNVIVENAAVKAENVAGALVGWNEGVIRDSHVRSSNVDVNGGPTPSVWGDSEVNRVAIAGGLVGLSLSWTNTALIVDSSAEITMQGRSVGIGGLVGMNRAEIRGSSSFGVINSSGSVGEAFLYGGLVGLNVREGKISESFSRADLLTSAVAVGGLVGGNEGTIINSYADGTVEGSDIHGGLVGGHGEDGVIEDSFAYGEVRDADGAANLSGGLLGGAAEPGGRGGDWAGEWVVL